MTKIELLKSGVGFVTGFGVSHIVHQAIANNVATEKTYEKVAVLSSRVVLAMMVSEKVREYTDNKIDAAAAWYKENVR